MDSLPNLIVSIAILVVGICASSTLFFLCYLIGFSYRKWATRRDPPIYESRRPGRICRSIGLLFGFLVLVPFISQAMAVLGMSMPSDGLRILSSLGFLILAALLIATPFVLMRDARRSRRHQGDPV